MLVFAKEINNRSKIDAAAKQLEYMAKNNMGHGVEGKYSRAWDTLKPAYDEYCEWASRIASISRCYKDGMCDLLGILRDGSEISLFTYFTDELSFLDCELIGLTVDEALKLRQDRDVAYLQS